MLYLQWASAALGLVSAGLWLTASLLKFPAPMAYLSGAPKHVVDRINLIGRLNAGGAACAGISVGGQAILTWLASTAA